MREPTFFDKIKEPFKNIYLKIEYFFAKRWLDSNFGEVKYWGDYLYEKLEGCKENRELAICSREEIWKLISRITSFNQSNHNEALLKRVEEKQKLFNFIPQDEYGYKRVKASDLDLEDIKLLINKKEL